MIFQTMDPKDVGENLLYGHFFPRNCMKVKEIGPRTLPYTSHTPLAVMHVQGYMLTCTTLVRVKRKL